MPQAPTQAQTLEERYGSSRKRSFDRRFAWGASGVLLAAGLGFLLFSGWQNGSQVSAQDIGYTKTDDYTVDMKFEVSAPPNKPVACVVEALDSVKATVGWKVVEIPVTDERTHVVTSRIVTTGPVAAAYARACWIVEQQAE